MPERPRKLQLKVGFEGKPESGLAVTAYVFDEGGTLVTSAPVRNGAAELALPPGGRAPRIVLGPAQLGEEGPPTLERLRRLGGHEPTVKLTRATKSLELRPIPEIDWRRWFLCQCRVRGRVVRPVALPGGVQELPVCDAIVHICEVDRWPLVIAKLPDTLLERLRTEILVGPVGPVPEPDPPPFVVDPGVIDPSPLALARVERTRRLAGETVSLNPQPLPPGEARAAKLKASGRPPVGDAAADEAPIAAGLSPAVRAALGSPSLTSVRATLVTEAVQFVPYLCRWRWLWPWFTCDEVAVVTTDAFGRFDATIWYPCAGDRPDVYVWVEYPIAGTPTTVYRPPIACNTHWNYQCGTELTVRVTDPRVPWCGGPVPPAGKRLVVLSIGSGIGFDEVQPESAGATAGLTVAGQPMGGSLEPAVLFGDGLIPAGITHYRWSVRRVGEPAAAWRGLSDTEVGRHYLPSAGDSFLWVSLGPDLPAPQGAVFKIQPADPPSGSWAPSVAVRLNNATGFFPSHLEAGGNPVTGAGKYELKLELFKVVGGSPQLVNLTAEGIEVKVLDGPAPAPPGPVPFKNAPAPNLIVSGANVVGFRWVVHVDNNPCDSNIVDVVVPPHAAGPCGFVPYDPDAVPPAEATIAFRAHHPNGFATFSFVVSKGSTGPVAAASASGPVTQLAANGFVNDGTGNFTKNVPVTTLLGGCNEAAFAETNYVDAMATDGWGSLDYLDDSGPSKAFALEPEGD